jgi:phosphoribosylformylglycinamidine cyclo-ligase
MEIESRAPKDSDDSSYQRLAGTYAGLEGLGLPIALERFRQTWLPGRVALDFGHFANVINLGPRNELSLAISTDGVGTKTIIAQLMDKYDTIGIDCIAMNVNDVICVGSRPDAIVDYIAIQKPNKFLLDELAKGLETGARLAEVSIVGGEIAQLPDLLQGEEGETGFDLVATCVGTIVSPSIITGKSIVAGDIILGLESSGIHSNGLTLARKVLGVTASNLNKKEKKKILSRYFPEFRKPLGEELLIPTKIYVAEILNMIDLGIELKGIAHITGDGFLNLPRLESNVGYIIDELPEPPPIFQVIQQMGALDAKEMFEIFNMGIGLCLVVSEDDVPRVREVARSHGTGIHRIGFVVEDPTRRVTLAQFGISGCRGMGFSFSGGL